MNRQTRSGHVFAAWDRAGTPTVIETGISLGPFLEAALASADKRADQREHGLVGSSDDHWQGLYGDERDEEWEDDAEVSMRPPSALSDASDASWASDHCNPSPPAAGPSPPTAGPSPPAAGPSLPAQTDQDDEMPGLEDVYDNDDLPVPPSARAIPIERKRRNQAAARRLTRKRAAEAALPKNPYKKKPKLRYDQGYRTLPPERVNFATEGLPHSRTAFLGHRPRNGRRGRIYTVAELERLGYRLIKWDGRSVLD